jgi:hypothetical protein
VVAAVAVARAAAAAVVVEAAVADGRTMTMRSFTSPRSKATPMNLDRICTWLCRLVLLLALGVPATASAAAQQTFASPEAAVAALMSALQADSDAALIALFGDQSRDFIVGADHAAASATRARVLAAMKTLRVLREPTQDRRVLVIGEDAWPVPIPIVRIGNEWRFATEEGKEELVNRRVGGNERNAIYVLHAYVDAQRAYAARDRDGDGVLQYARKLASSPGKHDGLYWPAEAGTDDVSPLGPLVAESAVYLKGRVAGEPYRGYHFKIVTRQGSHAAGGAYDYVINGRMIAGFAMVAYPAAYGQSGVMTFIVSHNGKVYERDLGKQSTALGAKITSFDPGPGWKEVAP